MKLKITFLLSLSILIITSCSKKEGCTDITATNFDSDADNACESCCKYPEEIIDTTDPRDEYLGSYTVVDTSYILSSVDNVQTYTLVVTKDESMNAVIYLNNLSNSNMNFEAILNTNTGSFSIPSQQVSGPYYLTGSGSINGNNISYETSGDAYENIGNGSK